MIIRVNEEVDFNPAEEEKMKVYIETLGCPKNVVDSENMAGILESAGHQICNDPETSEVMIVNTCGFINDAKKESIDMIFELAELKGSKGYDENSPESDETVQNKLLIVTGCLSQRYPHELFDEIPEADIIIGVNDYTKLPEIIARIQKW
jgi:ribosomal protein S12 methylthiotransferase